MARRAQRPRLGLQALAYLTLAALAYLAFRLIY